MTSVPMTGRALREYAAARGWLLGRGRTERPARFAAAVRAARDRIAADPTSLPLHPGSDRVRRCRVAGFDYDLLFTARPSGPIIVSVWSYHRNPADRPA